MKRLVTAALVAATLVGGGVAARAHVAGADSHQGSAPVAVAPAPETTAPSTPTPTPAPAPPSTQPTQQAVPPVEPRAPKQLSLWKFHAPVVPIDLDGGTLVPPDDPTVLGWWGQPAGSPMGTTLLVGHTVSTGGGTLDDLEHVKVGEIANVSGVEYEVTRVMVMSKAQLAKRAERLFDQTGTHKLALVTCEGFNPATRTYSENVVVIARPVR